MFKLALDGRRYVEATYVGSDESKSKTDDIFDLTSMDYSRRLSTLEWLILLSGDQSSRSGFQR